MCCSFDCTKQNTFLLYIFCNDRQNNEHFFLVWLFVFLSLAVFKLMLLHLLANRIVFCPHSVLTKHPHQAKQQQNVHSRTFTVATHPLQPQTASRWILTSHKCSNHPYKEQSSTITKTKHK